MNLQGRKITRVKNQNDPEKPELKTDKNESEILVTGQEKSENWVFFLKTDTYRYNFTVNCSGAGFRPRFSLTHSVSFPIVLTPLLN